MKADDEKMASALRAIAENLWSPNESDRNLEAANVVDGLFAIARSLNRVAIAIEEGTTSAKVGDALDGLAAIRYFDFQNHSD